jgi:hypothetical protein
MDKSDMHIELTLVPDHVEVIFANESSAPLRLWELENSWGWRSVSFQIRSEQDTGVSTILHDWRREWTVNAPTVFVLAPGEKRGFPMNLNDGWWMRDQTISRLKDSPLLARVSYHADPAGPDLLRFLTDPNVPDWRRRHDEQWASEVAHVFTGSVVSDWVLSQPPHGWLFAPIPYIGETAAPLLQHPPEEVLRRVCALIAQRAWNIKVNAEAINEDPTATLAAFEKMMAGMTAGHLVNSILEDCEEILKTVSEARAYLEAKTVPPTKDETGTTSQD